MSKFLNRRLSVLFGLLVLFFFVSIGIIIGFGWIPDGSQPTSETVYRSAGIIRTPVEIGSGGRSKYAYLKMALSFRVNNDSDFGGVFQTDDYNKGARFEIHDGIASLVVANSRKDDGYDIYVIPEKILKNRWYGLEVEVQNHGYVNLTLNGKKYFQINDRGVSASMSHIVIGRGFDEGRIFDGTICNIEARTGDNSKFLLNLKRIYNLQYETYYRFFGAILVLLLVVIFWRNGHLGGVAMPVRRLIKDVRPFSLPLLLMVQAALIWRYDAYRTVISGYVLLFVMGGVLYPLIAPSGVMRQRSIYVIWPVIGLTYLSIFGGYLIGYSVDSSFYLTACLASLSIMTVINLMFNRTRFMAAAETLREDFADLVVYGTALVTPVVLVLIYPVLAAGYMTSVYRVGPDMMQYAKMADYLMSGGSLELSRLRAGEFSGMTPGEMNRYADATMSWPLMNYFRWGITFYQVIFAKISGASHSYQVAFISMVIPYLLEAGMVYVWLRRISGFMAVIAFSGFLLCAFNVNLLNLWYEGFLGNAFANVLLLWVLLLHAQMMDDDDANRYVRWEYALLVCFIMAALFLSYGEILLFVFPLFFFMTITAEFFVYRQVRWNNHLTLAIGGLLGLLTVLPCNYFFDWAVLTVKQLLHEGGNGYAQPLWAMPNEILGLGDIYSYLTIDKAGKLMERTSLDMVLGVLLIVVVVAFVSVDLAKDPRRSKVLKIAALMIMATSGVLVYLKSPGNNYTYMKVYVLFAPLMAIAFVGGVERWSRKTEELQVARQLVSLLVFAIPVVLNGVLYVVQYVRQETVIEKKQMELARVAKCIDFTNALLIPYNLGNKRVIYTAIMPALWAVPEFWNKKNWSDKPYYRIHSGKKLYLLAEKEREVTYKVNGDVVFENGAYLIVDTKKSIQDVCSDNKHDVDFDLVKKALEEQR